MKYPFIMKLFMMDITNNEMINLLYGLKPFGNTIHKI